MARVELSDVLLRNGEPVPSALVSVKVVAGAAGSNTLYTSEAGSSTLSELRTKANGEFTCWVEEGRYEVTAGSLTKTVEAVNQASVAAGSVGPETITAEKIASAAVTAAKLKAESVDTTKLTSALKAEVENKGTIGVEAVTTEKIANLAVTNAKIAGETIEGSKLKTETIAKTKLEKAFQEEIEKKALAVVESNERTAAYTLVLGDKEKCIDVNKASETKITIPKNSEVAFPVGTTITFTQIGGGIVKLEPAVGVTIRNPGAALTTRTQYSTIAIRQKTVDLWVASGDLT